MGCCSQVPRSAAVSCLLTTAKHVADSALFCFLALMLHDIDKFSAWRLKLEDEQN